MDGVRPAAAVVRSTVGAMPAPEPARQQEPADERARDEQSRAAGVLGQAGARIEQAAEQTGRAIQHGRKAVEHAEQAVERAVRKVVVEDPRGIRALAHPARVEAIDRLYAGEILTATELAEAVEVSPSAMSYHLRELAKWGVIERVEDGTDGRERRWRAAGTDLQIGAPGSAHSTASRAAQTALTSQTLEWVQRGIEEHLANVDEEPEEWRGTLEFSTYDLILTRGELRELSDEMRRMIERFDLRRGDPPEDAHKVRMTTIAVPARDKARKT